LKTQAFAIMIQLRKTVLIYLVGLIKYVVPVFRIVPYIDNMVILTKSKAVNIVRKLRNRVMAGGITNEE